MPAKLRRRGRRDTAGQFWQSPVGRGVSPHTSSDDPLILMDRTDREEIET